MSLPYYPMYPRDFFEGTQEMSLELKGAYIMVLNLMYTRGGPVSDEPGFISRYVGCSVRKWKQVRDELVAIGKIIVKDGMICNSRADEELEKQRSYRDQKAENRSRPNKNKAEKSRPREEPKPEPQMFDDADASSHTSERVKPHFIPADWKPSPELMRWAVDEYRTPSGETLTPEEITHEADSFVDYWLGRRDAKAKRPGWDATFRARIREQAPKILRTRPRTQRAAGANGSGYGRPQSRYAPAISQHDAFAIAGAAASDAQRGGRWEPDHGNGSVAPIGTPRLEVLDRPNEGRPEPGGPRRDRRDSGETLFPLPVAAVR